MTRIEYYQLLKSLARQVRTEFGLTSPRVMLSDMRRIYRAYDIKIDYWEGQLKVARGAYYNDDLGVRVMVAKKLPAEQRIYTLAHELKHHLVDQQKQYEVDKEAIEIGAEIFAAELIFPEADFIAQLEARGVKRGECTPEHVVALKHTSGTTLSYGSLAKRAEWLGFADRGSLVKTKWHALATQMYGEPLYKQIVRARRAVAATD